MSDIVLGQGLKGFLHQYHFSDLTNVAIISCRISNPNLFAEVLSDCEVAVFGNYEILLCYRTGSRDRGQAYRVKSDSKTFCEVVSYKTAADDGQVNNSKTKVLARFSSSPACTTRVIGSSLFNKFLSIKVSGEIKVDIVSCEVECLNEECESVDQKADLSLEEDSPEELPLPLDSEKAEFLETVHSWQFEVKNNLPVSELLQIDPRAPIQQTNDTAPSEEVEDADLKGEESENVISTVLPGTEERCDIEETEDKERLKTSETFIYRDKDNRVKVAIYVNEMGKFIRVDDAHQLEMQVPAVEIKDEGPEVSSGSEEMEFTDTVHSYQFEVEDNCSISELLEMELGAPHEQLIGTVSASERNVSEINDQEIKDEISPVEVELKVGCQEAQTEDVESRAETEQEATAQEQQTQLQETAIPAEDREKSDPVAYKALLTMLKS